MQTRMKAISSAKAERQEMHAHMSHQTKPFMLQGLIFLKVKDLFSCY